jgi:hypothetical protein
MCITYSQNIDEVKTVATAVRKRSKNKPKGYLHWWHSLSEHKVALFILVLAILKGVIELVTAIVSVFN